jgi:hypothetical protein
VTPGRPVVRRSVHRPQRHRTAAAAVAGALALILAVTVLAGLPSGASAANAATGTATINVAAAASQCAMGLGRPQKGSVEKAVALMAGHASLGEYGSFHLAANPSWKPVSTLDSSGKGYMHALHYLLPLLRVGVRHHDTAMIDRFYFLVHDWFNDNKPGGTWSRYAWGPPIYEGFRSLVLVCAAAGPRGNAPWLMKALKQNGEMAASTARYEGINNASLHQQMGLYAIGATIGRPAWRRLAVQRIDALAVRLIHTDGSVEEGAITYAVNDYRWFLEAAERMRRAGDPAPAWLSRVAAIPGFIAQATRPDGRTEALGDSSPNLLAPPTRWAGTAAEWSSTNGAAGVAPSSTFASYAGGYVFGRSGWGSATRPYSDETFYSLRAGTTSSIPHAHDDSGSLTLYSHGSELLFDTGQWEYLYGTTRQFIVSRAAHNVVLVNGVRRSDPRPALTTAQAPDLDMSTVVDTGYEGVTLTRTVAYDRADDVVLVWDRLAAPKDVTGSQQWGLGRDRTVDLQQDTAHTTGPGANVSLFFTAGGAPLDVKSGAKSPMRGWNSEAYGEIAPAPSLRATQRGSQLSWLTVIAPRADGVPGSAYSATSSVSTTGASVLLTTPTGSATVNLDGTGGSRTVPTAVTPVAYATAPIVLAGSATKIRGTGLAPGAPVTLESLATGATDWVPVATGKASPSGTVVLPVTVPTTADYRLASGLAATAPVHVTAAVAPQPPTGVTATPSGRGQVTVTWTPPVDTGGAPLTQYAVRIGDKRVVVPAGATSAVVSGLLAGPTVATVRAFNAVAQSAWAPVAVTVPAYPSVSGPSTARKGSTVRLTLAGLLPHQPATLRVTNVKSGKTVTRTVTPRPATGGAVVSLTVRSTVRVVAVSGGLRSAVHRIGVPLPKHH